MNLLAHQLLGESILGFGLTFPHLKFFKPNDNFYQVMEEFNGKNIVDAGAGVGHVASGLRNEGHSCVAIDINARDDSEDVLITDATSFDYSSVDVVLICRPDHSGWTSPLIDHIRSLGKVAIYVGLEENFESDLTEEQDEMALDMGVVAGNDGERMLIWGDE